ncbi:hypothetical protein OPW41_08860 [Vibrio europaeus]|uniref:hypothetical protein n=1 Tax=Vibrio europaeus TaxID=300876 RepID=UPI00233F2FEA|nr:hypothetical protein [Vibrio europaeus]MDC5755217.1 hypothetical protein [Vibrio europaeus]MDC5775796.1 hypothetical protein [Vibrio europaeus]MDC5794934.1 hypothetical protein [Vibrio europaeus]MDC5799505.1 hypothetical protein [Vibrio europaeus]MDC5817213.1 hypothetical protein [Vibrio europaeus]
MTVTNLHGEQLIKKTIHVPAFSTFSNSAEMLTSGFVLLRTLSDMIDALPDFSSVTPEDLSRSIRVAEELIQLGIAPSTKK